jgi:hypothetical protein
MMRDAVTIVICLLFNSFAMRAQEWGWAKAYDAGGHDIVTSLGGTDKDGNIYYITNTRVYYNPPNAPPPWNFCKADPQGNILWKKTDVGGVCKTDNDKNIYVASGSTLLKYDVEGNVIWSLTEPYTYFQNIFVANDRLILNGWYKMDTSKSILVSFDLHGKKLWMNFSGYGVLNAPITVDKLTNSYIYSYSVSTTNPISKKTLFKYNSDGKLISSVAAPSYPKTILSDFSGNTYLLGTYEGKYGVQFNDKHYFGSSTHTINTFFLAKYSTQGNLLWYKLFSGLFGGMELINDNNGNPHLSFETTFIKYDNIDISPNALTVFRLDENNGNILWYKTSEGEIYGERAGNTVQARAAFSSKGDLIFAGGFKNGYKFGNSSLKCDDYCDIFLAKLSLKNVTTVTEKNELNTSSITVFPNPSGDVFTVITNGSSRLSYILLDALGRIVTASIVRQTEDKTLTVDLSSKPKGVYFLSLQTDKGTEVKKLIHN